MDRKYMQQMMEETAQITWKMQNILMCLAAQEINHLDNIEYGQRKRENEQFPKRK